MSKSSLQQSLHTTTGIFWMVTTMFFFVSMDTCAKYLVGFYPTMQVVWGRYFFQVLILIIVLGPRLGKIKNTNNLGL